LAFNEFIVFCDDVCSSRMGSDWVHSWENDEDKGVGPPEVIDEDVCKNDEAKVEFLVYFWHGILHEGGSESVEALYKPIEEEFIPFISYWSLGFYRKREVCIFLPVAEEQVMLCMETAKAHCAGNSSRDVAEDRHDLIKQGIVMGEIMHTDI